ncbi:MAG TPA: MMPL family transporter [Microbacteriaceae bacterium]|nr:MMPL family transporter [Microbacteriaceae bacterium]HRA08282.1 MMPL family transporter [Microbacteriaceae bacterium]
MSEKRVSSGFANALTSRRGAWVSILLAVLAVVGVFGALSGAEAPSGNDAAPPASESAAVTALLSEFNDSAKQTVLLVASRDDGSALTAADLDAMRELAPRLDAETGFAASPPFASEDGLAAVMQTSMTQGADNGATAEVVFALRDIVAEHPIDGVTVQITGGPAFGADITSAFAGADFTLLIVTIGIVALLLILTYRSPLLWIVPLVVVALADRMAGLVTAVVGTGLELQFDSGIVSVLVFGAGTNYALLLISRYREELLRNEDHRAALAQAWCKTAPAILASNVTVVLSLATLVFAVIPGTRGLGISSAVGLLIALAFGLLVLPPVLAVCGRGIFWPFVPKPGQHRVQGRAWRAIATRVVARPVVSIVAAGALLVIMASGLIGASVGLNQTDKFRVAAESAAGLEVLGEHFPAGEAQPMIIVANTGEVPAVVAAAEGIDGVIRVTPVSESRDASLTRILVTGEPAPSTPESLALVEQLRAAVHDIDGADALVGGVVATDVDARAGNTRDLLVIAPLVLLVSFIVLLVLLRSLVAPVLLMLVNLLSAVAAIGGGAWLSRVLFDQPALDLQVPLLSFLFLVALGIDYTIFLVHRARAEAQAFGTKRGMVEAVAGTGGVITSAGIVLAAVFAALGVLPLVTLGQIGLIVGLGVIVDTFVVRTIMVPAIFSLVGDRIWWPGRIPGGSRAPGAAPSDGRAAGGGESEHVEHSEAALT